METKCDTFYTWWNKIIILHILEASNNIVWCMGSKNNLDDIILLAYDEHAKKITFC